MKKSISDIKKICIINVGLLGDVLMRTPVVREIRKIFPSALIYCVADPVGVEILSLNSHVDFLYKLNRSKKNKFQYYLEKLKAQCYMLENNFDLIIDMYGGESTNAMMKLNFATYKIGFVNGKPWSNTLGYKERTVYLQNPYHLTHNYFKLLYFFEEDYNNSTKPVLKYHDSTYKEIENYINTFSSKDIQMKKLFLVSLGSGGLEKILDFKKQFSVIKYIHKEYGYIPAVISNPGQEFLQESFINDHLGQSNIPYIKLKKLDLDEVSSLMDMVNFVYLPDTGLYHMAVGLSVPILCIFTHTNPILVQPDEGVFKACFKNTDTIDLNGVTLGSPNLEEDYLKDCVNSFMILHNTII